MEKDEFVGDVIESPAMLAALLQKKFSQHLELINKAATRDDWAKIIVETKDILNRVNAVDSVMAEQKKELEKFFEAVKKQGETLNHVKSLVIRPGAGSESFRDRLLKALEAGALNDIIEEKSAKNKIQIDTKDLAFTGTYGSGAAQHAVMPFTQPQYPDMEAFDVRMVVPTGTIDSEKLDYPQERAASLTDNTAFVTENNETTTNAFGFTMATVNSKRATAHIKISRRALRNTGWLANYISNRLMALFVKLLNTKVIAGEGSGSDLDGLVHNAKTFAGTNFQNKIANANFMDVLNCAKGEMQSLYHLTPNAILINPVDATILASTKNTIADWINPATFLQANNVGYNGIFGMRPVSTADITVGSYLLAAINAAYMELLFNGPIEILTSDSDDDNFTKNLVTMKLEADVMLPIYNTNALMKGTLETDLSTIAIS